MMNMAKMMLKIIVNKVIKCINIIVMMVLNMKVNKVMIMKIMVLNRKVMALNNKAMALNRKVKMMVLNIICIGVIVRLVSITPGHVKLD